MSKAITGAIEIAAGVALLLSPIGGAVGALWLPLVLSGASSEIGALADLLQSQKGVVATTRQAAAPRRVIYGTQRVGGVQLFSSPSGSSNSQLNTILVFAAHEITNFMSLFLDGRECFWHGAGGGWSIRNGIGFGGAADGLQHTAPDGTHYTFNNAITGHSGVFCEARFGDQAFGDYMSSLTTNDGRWAPDGTGDIPSLVGHAYLYLKVEADQNTFPSIPEVRCLIRGKGVYDPRTGETGYSENWALIVADIIKNTEWGLGSMVNVDNLIAAANVCDEQVAFSGGGGGVEARYTCNYSWTLDKGIGTVLGELMAGAGARFSYIEGEFYLFPATFYGSSATFTYDRLIAASPWTPQRKFKDKANSVQGTYVAPEYPFSVVGNYYGFNNTNGDGTAVMQNNFDFNFQPTSYPTFTMDTAHGYPSNQYLLEDGNVELSLSLDFPSVLSVTQAQRLAKIALLRNRQQGSGSLKFGLEAWAMQPNDTFSMTFTKRGWENKLLEIQSMSFSCQATEDGAQQIQVQVDCAETDPSVYEWLPTDELTVYYNPTYTVDPNTYSTLPPTNLALLSSAGTALTQPDGSVTPRIQVTWATPADARVVSIQVQYQVVGATAWSDGGMVSVASNIAFLNAVAGDTYSVRIRSLRPNGASSDWVTGTITAGLVLSVGNQTGIGVGHLIGEAYADGTAGIEVTPFTATLGTLSVSYFPSGAVTIPSLVQQTFYYVYLYDPTLAGGDLPAGTGLPGSTAAVFATTDKSDYLGKVGCYLIDTVLTPYTVASGAGQRYYPSDYSDTGTRTTLSPQNAFDGDPSTSATVSGSFNEVWVEESGSDDESGGVHTETVPPPLWTPIVTSTTGTCTWINFPNVSLASDATLYMTASGVGFKNPNADAGTFSVNVLIAGTSSSSLTITSTTQTLTATIPAGTNLSTVTVKVVANPGNADYAVTGSHATATAGSTVTVSEIYIQ